MNAAIAARVFTALAVCTMVFQVALVAGAPWGVLAWGGAFPGALPARMRMASAASVFVLLALSLIVLARAGSVFPGWMAASPARVTVARKLVWVVVAYCALGVIANALTPSVWERAIWLPVTVLQLGCSVIVARTR